MKELPFNEQDARLRNSYIDDISSIQPLDTLEAADIQKTLDWLRSAKYVHKPQNMDYHLGVLFMLISPDRNSTYLINHRKAQLWIPPGGHVDQGLTLQEAVELEMLEELHEKPKFISRKPFFLTQTLTSGLNSGHVDVTSWFLVNGDPKVNYSIQEKEAEGGAWFKLVSIEEELKQSYLSRAVQKILSGNY